MDPGVMGFMKVRQNHGRQDARGSRPHTFYFRIKSFAPCLKIYEIWWKIMICVILTWGSDWNIGKPVSYSTWRKCVQNNTGTEWCILLHPPFNIIVVIAHLKGDVGTAVTELLISALLDLTSVVGRCNAVNFLFHLAESMPTQVANQRNHDSRSA